MVSDCVEHLSGEGCDRIIVVDNASDDGTTAALRAGATVVDVVRFDTHGGLSRAFNAGVARGRAPYVLFLNDDMFTRPGSVARLAATLGAAPQAVSTGGRLVDPGDGRTQEAYLPRTFPGLGTFVMALSGLDRLWPGHPWRSRPIDRDGSEKPIVVEQPAGTGLLVRRSALEAIGGWDERYSFWYEDVDLSRRLAGQGTALYEPAAVFRHIGGATVSRWTRAESLRRYLHGLTQYAGAHLGRRQRAVLGIVLVLASLPRIVVFGVLRRADMAALYRDGLRVAGALLWGRAIPPLVAPRPAAAIR